MDRLVVAGTSYQVGRAVPDDVAAIVTLLHDDELGASRESQDLAPYRRAFEMIDQDANHLLAVVKDPDTVVATMHLVLLPGLTHVAATRLHIEAVRVGSAVRGTGLGSAMLEWAHRYGRARGAVLAQLTTHRTRVDAQRFYARAGYVDSHVGLKRLLLEG